MKFIGKKTKSEVDINTKASASSNKPDGDAKFGFVRRYAGAVTVLAIFVGVVVTGAAYNYLSAQKLEENTSTLNAIAQEKTLSQKISKDILLIEQEFKSEGKFNQALFDQLSKNKEQFTQIQRVLNSGGTFKIDETGQAFHINANSEYKQFIKEVDVAWSPLNIQIDLLQKLYAEKMAPNKDKSGAETLLVGRSSRTYVLSDTNETLPNDLINNPNAVAQEVAPTDESLLQVKKEVTTELTETTRILKNNNLTLLESIEKFNKKLNDLVNESQEELRRIQLAILSLSIVFFLILVFYFFRKLIQTDEKAFYEQKEKSAILENVREGLFLMNKEWIIEQEGSAALEEILGQNIEPPMSFHEMLKGMVDEKAMKSAEKFVDILFSKDVKESLISQLNPLQMIEVNQTVKKGSTILVKKQYLSINFNKIKDNKGKTSKILVTILDSTEKQKLEEKLKEEKAKATSQFDFLIRLLQSENKTGVVDFLRGLEHSMEEQNKKLKNSSVEEHSLLATLNSFQKELHSFKAEAGALGLSVFQNILHDFEDKIIEIRQTRPITAENLHIISFYHKDILEKTKGIINSISSYEETFLAKPVVAPVVVASKLTAPVPQKTSTALVELLKSSAKAVSEAYHKQVNVLADLDDINVLSDSKQEKLKHMLLHLVNNAVVHGLEDPVTRQKQGKHPVGVVTLTSKKANVNGKDMIQVSVKDDGAGLNIDKIKARAIQSGLISEAEAQKLGAGQIISFIFRADFSTATEVTKQAGRGIGMNYVQTEIQAMGGKVGLGMRPGQYTEFTLTIPV